MFSDFEGRDDDDTIAASMSDREIAWVLWRQRETADEQIGWALLAERYPDRADFLAMTLARCPGEDDLVFAQLRRLEQNLGGATEGDARLAQLACALREGDGEWSGRVATWLSKHDDGTKFDAANKALLAWQLEILRECEKATAGGRPIAAAAASEGPALPYAASGYFPLGSRVEHPKFGVGVVTKVLEGKVNAKFGEHERVLIARGEAPRAARDEAADAPVLADPTHPILKRLWAKRAALRYDHGWIVLEKHAWKPMADGTHVAVAAGDPVCFIDGELCILEQDSKAFVTVRLEDLLDD